MDPAMPPSQATSDHKERIVIIGGLVLFVIILGVIITLLVTQKPDQFSGLFTSRTLTPTPSVSPKPLICSGDYTFTVTGGDKEPRIVQGRLNPCDPKAGSMQFLTVIFASNSAVTEAEVQVTTDTKKDSYPMKKVSDSEGWKASWRMEDTYNDVYQVAITGKTDKSEKTTTLTFR